METILVVTQDKHLPKHITRLGSVITMEKISDAIGITEDDYDLVILGPPYDKEKAKLIPHANIRVIEQPEDLKTILKEFANKIEKQPGIKKETNKGSRKFRVDSDINLPYHEVNETILLVTTDIELIKSLNCFNLLIATNKYSALRHIENITQEIALVIWDKDSILTKTPKVNIPILYWGEEVKNKKDIYLLLTSGQISI